ncbi:MAG: hypothetical protein P8R37_10550 [Opitutae bacterium]|nr:hypothetical protein [Opitutae bacterium]MDG1302014.1 hypothetical protein [Opitutae bacterium]
MKNRLRFTVLLLSPLFQLGCVSVDERMQGYVGQHYANVVATWGEPDSEIDNGEGGKLLTWHFITSHTTPARVTTTTTHNTNSSLHSHAVQPDTSHRALHHYAATQYGSSKHATTRSHEHVNTTGNQVSTTTYIPESTSTNTYTRSFYTDSEGLIYKFAWKGWHPGY